MPAPAAVLARMDLNMAEMYREQTRAVPGGWIVDRDGVACCGTPRGTVTTNTAIVTGAADAAAVAAVTRDTFVARGQPFSVWTRAHADAPLEDALRGAGWLEIASTPGMTFHPGDGTPVPPPADVAIRPVRDDVGRVAYATIMAEAYALYGNPPESIAALFATLASLSGPVIDAFVAWHGDEPVAGAMLYRTHGIGGVGWVGTRPAWFGRGYGAAVTWAVVDAGLRAGVDFLSLQASPMGAPVYRRMGFRTPTAYRIFVPPF